MNKYEKLKKNLGKELKENEPMRRHTTFRIGGPADLFYEAKIERELVRVIGVIRGIEIPYFILGGGSNILVGDRGIRGIVIKVQSPPYESEGKFQVSNNGTKIYAPAGVLLSAQVNFAVSH